jgi:hypothetical protein
MTKPVTEAELIEKARGERVTLVDVEAAIIHEDYFTALEGVIGETYMRGERASYQPPSLGLMTICALTLWNGWTILGKSACADPANFNKDLGRRLARADAVNQIWPLMGYELKSRIAREQRLLGGALVDPQEGFETFIGTKVVNATPATKLIYCELRRWTCPENEDPDEEGYVVEYTDRIQNPPAVEGFQGYVTWSPKEVFERAYRRVGKAASAASNASPEAAGTASVREEKKETWLDRVRAELAELDARLVKLNAFLETNTFCGLPEFDRRDLGNQQFFMEGYRNVLERRLSRYPVVD